MFRKEISASMWKESCEVLTDSNFTHCSNKHEIKRELLLNNVFLVQHSKNTINLFFLIYCQSNRQTCIKKLNNLELSGD